MIPRWSDREWFAWEPLSMWWPRAPHARHREPPTGERGPPLNVWLGDERAVVALEVPGADPKSFDITVDEQRIRITGEVPADEPPEGHKLLRRERSVGRFERTVELPFRVESTEVEAAYERGILRIEAPRARAERPRRVEVAAH